MSHRKRLFTILNNRYYTINNFRIICSCIYASETTCINYHYCVDPGIFEKFSGKFALTSPLLFILLKIPFNVRHWHILYIIPKHLVFRY